MPATIDPGLQMQVRMAARGLAHAGLVHAFGHCSARIDARHFLVCAAMPMGLIKDEPGTIVSVDGALPQKVLGEVRAHQAIYAARPMSAAFVASCPPPPCRCRRSGSHRRRGTA